MSNPEPRSLARLRLMFDGASLTAQARQLTLDTHITQLSGLSMPKDKNSYSFHCLLHAADLIEDYLRIQLQPLHVSPRQARVLKALGFLGEISQVELAREFGITAASMSTMTSRLLALEFIAANKDPKNAKRHLLSLTPKGQALLDDISRAWASTDAFMEQSIGHNNAQQLAELSRQLRDALGGHKPGERVKKAGDNKG